MSDFGPKTSPFATFIANNSLCSIIYDGKSDLADILQYKIELIIELCFKYKPNMQLQNQK